ncbi:hydrolase [Burkholderia mayonis]|uniref:hydrolase n=1 Tax=Burkholderia mayonis TaxID=1385591 RepID=UPI0009E9C52B
MRQPSPSAQAGMYRFHACPDERDALRHGKDRRALSLMRAARRASETTRGCAPPCRTGSEYSDREVSRHAESATRANRSESVSNRRREMRRAAILSNVRRRVDPAHVDSTHVAGKRSRMPNRRR